MTDVQSTVRKTVMVCGYFDGLHPGHIRFLQKASLHGDVIVGVGCDKRLQKLKRAFPLFNESERIAMVAACRFVKRAFLLDQVEGESGIVWESALKAEAPDSFMVNDDIDSDWLERQREVCVQNGVRFLVSNRDCPEEWQPTSSSALRELKYPYRVCLTTGMDQVSLSSLAKGACVGFSIDPTVRFDDRSGMATSTRKTLMHAFGGRGMPDHLDGEDQAKLAFALDNPPRFPTGKSSAFPFGSFASRYITGSVDPITMLVPGVTLCEYQGGPWPAISVIDNEETLAWLESVVTLVQTAPRPEGEHFRLHCDADLICRFAATTYWIWRAIQDRDLVDLQKAVNTASDLFGQICPTNIGNGICEEVGRLRSMGLGTCVQGAGYGGYIACIADDPGDRIPIRLRRPKLQAPGLITMDL